MHPNPQKLVAELKQATGIPEYQNYTEYVSS